MAFRGTVWEVSKTLVKVRLKKNTRASMCMSILLVEERERASLSVYLCMCAVLLFHPAHVVSITTTSWDILA